MKMSTSYGKAPNKTTLPPLLSMTIKSQESKSEYNHHFTPKMKHTQVNVKLAPSFMYRRPPAFVRGQPKCAINAGIVPAARSGETKDYRFLHNNSFYSSTQHERAYFTIRPDWVSETNVRKNNPFSWCKDADRRVKSILTGKKDSIRYDSTVWWSPVWWSRIVHNPGIENVVYLKSSVYYCTSTT